MGQSALEQPEMNRHGTRKLRRKSHKSSQELLFGSEESRNVRAGIGAEGGENQVALGRCTPAPLERYRRWPA